MIETEFKSEIDIAVLSDIHSNHVALQACIDYLRERKINKLIFLGDYVSNCAYPQKTMQIIYALMKDYTCWFIRGNREELLIKHADGSNDGWHVPSTSSGSILYTYNNLKETDIDFFRNMKSSDILDISGLPRLALCHGNMDSAMGVINQTNAEKFFEQFQTSLILCGHTHKSGCKEYEYGKVVNAGSVGTPVNGNGNAEVVIIHGSASGWIEEFVTVPFDRMEVVKELDESGLIEQSKMFGRMIRDLLTTNQDRWNEVLNLAKQICEQETGNAKDAMDDKYLEKAAAVLGIE